MDDFKRANPDWYLMMKEYAKKMRNNPTEAEAYLWRFLKSSKIGLSFKRQCVILDYIADFYCPEKKLIIEIDGGYHNIPEQLRWDEQRSIRMRNVGYRVIRFTNEEVLNNIETVLYKIKEM